MSMPILHDYEYRLDPPDPPYEYCPDCCGEMYNGDVLIDYMGKGEYICARCVLNKLQELKNDPETLAGVIRSKTRKVEL